MKVSIIIVTWNSRSEIEECLASIRNSDFHDFEVIIVDNNSSDETTKIIKTNFPEFQMIQNKINLGFAKACNVGANQARGGFLLFLNPDTEVCPNLIRGLSERLDSSPGIGMLSPRILNPNGTPQLASPRHVPSLLSEFLSMMGLRNAFPKNKICGHYGFGWWNHDEECEAEVISGSCMFIRKKAFFDVRGFDEDFFLGGEDIWLCHQIRKKGWKIIYFPAVFVVHHGGKSMAKLDEIKPDASYVLHCENLAMFFRKKRGLWYAVLYRILILFISLGWLLIETVRSVFLYPIDRQKIFDIIIPRWRKLALWSMGY